MDALKCAVRLPPNGGQISKQAIRVLGPHGGRSAMADHLNIDQLRQLAANDNEPPKVLVVPELHHFHSVSVMWRMAMVMHALPYSRRAIPDFMAAVLYSDVRLVTETGKVWRVPEIDHYLASMDAGCWFSEMRKKARNPPKQRPHANILPRMRLLYLAIALRYPGLAATILK